MSVAIALAIALVACDAEPAPPGAADGASLTAACRRAAAARRALSRARDAAGLLRRGDALVAAERAVAAAARSPAHRAPPADDYADALAAAAEALERSLRAGSESARLDAVAARAAELVVAAEARDEATIPSRCPPRRGAPLELNAFVARAELACHRFADDVQRVERLDVDGGARVASARLVTAIRDALRSFIEALERARDGVDGAAARRFVAVHRRRLATFDRLGVALLRRRRDDYYAAARAYVALSRAADAVSRRLGADECIRF